MLLDSLTKTGLWEGKGKMSKVNLTILPIKKENSSWWTDKTTFLDMIRRYKEEIFWRNPKEN